MFGYSEFGFHSVGVGCGGQLGFRSYMVVSKTPLGQEGRLEQGRACEDAQATPKYHADLLQDHARSRST